MVELSTSVRFRIVLASELSTCSGTVDDLNAKQSVAVLARVDNDGVDNDGVNNDGVDDDITSFRSLACCEQHIVQRAFSNTGIV